MGLKKTLKSKIGNVCKSLEIIKRKMMVGFLVKKTLKIKERLGFNH
jgi:hypothetical protein